MNPEEFCNTHSSSFLSFYKNMSTNLDSIGCLPWWKMKNIRKTAIEITVYKKYIFWRHTQIYNNNKPVAIAICNRIFCNLLFPYYNNIPFVFPR